MSTDTKDDLVTEEMVEVAARTYTATSVRLKWRKGAHAECMAAALKAVAPLIAAAIRARGETT